MQKIKPMGRKFLRFYCLKILYKGGCIYIHHLGYYKQKQTREGGGGGESDPMVQGLNPHASCCFAIIGLVWVPSKGGRERKEW